MRLRKEQLGNEQSGNARRANAWIMRIVAALGMIVLGYAVGVYTAGKRSITVAHAQDAQSTTYVNMPKAWGPMVGTMTGVLVFQDRAGTIRLVAANTGAVGEVITRN